MTPFTLTKGAEKNLEAIASTTETPEVGAIYHAASAFCHEVAALRSEMSTANSELARISSTLETMLRAQPHERMMGPRSR